MERNKIVPLRRQDKNRLTAFTVMPAQNRRALGRQNGNHTVMSKCAISCYSDKVCLPFVLRKKMGETLSVQLSLNREVGVQPI